MANEPKTAIALWSPDHGADPVALRQRGQYRGLLGGPQVISVSSQSGSAERRNREVFHCAFQGLGIIGVIPRVPDAAKGAIQRLRADTVLSQLVTTTLLGE